MNKNFILYLALAVFSFVSLEGCHHQMSKTSSSVPLSSFIKPISDSRQIDKKTPLSFPASVSILFIPGGTMTKGVHNPSFYDGVPYTTLNKAAQELKKQLLTNPKYISSVTVVQADEALSNISLGNIRASYGTDIVIILSYKQDQRNSQTGVAGLLDITIVGAFVVPGVETTTSTLIDAKVIHIPNNALIFRTSGTDERSTYSTSYGEKSTAVDESINGIIAATTEIGNALTKTLSKFENYDISQAVPIANLYANESGNIQSNDYWKKVDAYKSSGGGAFGFIPMFLALAVCYLARRRK